MQKKILLVTKSSMREFDTPYLWTSFKTYYEENGVYSDHWEWADPMIVSDYDEAVRIAVTESPDLIGFSLYVWNEMTLNDLAKELHEKLPNAYIVFGGPQCDIKYNEKYFQQKPYVDLVVPGDAYGEIITKEILDNIIKNDGKLISSQIPYCYYPDENRNVIQQDQPIDKKNFQWPNNPNRKQQKYFDKNIERLGLSIPGTFFLLETSRGCPYRCSFCDWGGGTYTKTVKKPFATVLDEIRWFGENKIWGVYITDANFGLFDIDIEYTKKLVETSKKYGYPKLVSIQSTKTKMKNLYAIFDLLSDAGLISEYKIAVEDLNEDVLKNIDRVDFPFEEKMEMVNKLREKYDFPIFLEGILGLPGSSLKTIQKDINRTIGAGWEYPVNHLWVLLPETPAYAPDYRKKWGIETIKSSPFASSYYQLKAKAGFNPPPGVTVVRDTKEKTTYLSEFVVGTSSYTKDEFVQMLTLQAFLHVLHNLKILNLPGRYLKEYHGVSFGDSYFEIVDFLLTDSPLSSDFQKVKNTIADWVHGRGDSLWINWRDEFNYELQPYGLLQLLTLTNPDEFYDSVGEFLANKFDDQKIIDLCNFSKFKVIHFNYRHGDEQTFNYNWKEWSQGEELTEVKSKYQTLDTHITNGPELSLLRWKNIAYLPDQIAHFFYCVCSTFNESKDVKNINRC